VVNSPWTAWRNLDHKPLPAGATRQAPARAPAYTSPRKQARPPAASLPSWSQFGDPGPVPQAAFESAVFESLEASTAAAEAPARDAAAPRNLLYEASLAQVTQTMSQVGSLDALQETVAVNPALTLDRLLSVVTAEEISRASGLPLARIEQTLADLRRGGEDEDAQELLAGPLTASERTVLEFALQKARRPAPAPAQDIGGAFEAVVADLPAPAADLSMPAGAQPGVVEEAAGKVRAEAERLLLAAGEEHYVVATRALGERLHQVANRLLQQADFVVRTDIQGHLQQANAAFHLLLAPDAAAPASDVQRHHEHLAIQRTWEAALAAAPVGRSSLPHPLAEQPFPPWDLHRTVLLDERTGAPQANLYVFRSANAPQLAWDAFQQVSALLPELALYSSLCAYGVAQSSGDYQQKLEAVVLRLEQLTMPPS
jgi:hypothetical protein